MIAAGNVVGIRITGDPAISPPANQGQQIQPSILQAQPPTFGNVLEVTGAGPFVIRVLWDNTNEASLTVTDIEDSNLDRITNGDASEVERLFGTISASAPHVNPRWVRHKSPVGDDTIDPSGGTSRSFDGTVVAVYRRTPVQEDDPSVGQTFCCICTEDGLFFEDVSTEFVVDENR